MKRLLIGFFLGILAVLSLVSIPVYATDSLQDSYNNTANADFAPTVYNGYSKAQTFTPSSTYTLGSIKLYISKQNSPGTLYCYLKSTSNGVPATDLDQTSVAASSVSTSVSWITFTFTGGISLTAGTKYAIALVHSGSAINAYSWYADGSSPTYSGGSGYFFSSNTWTEDTNYDFMFETYGTVQIGAPTITTSAATSISDTAATISGNVTSIGGENSTVTFYWGTSDGGTTAGNWANNASPDSPSQPQGVEAFSKSLTGLTSATTYYFRAKAVNSGGTTWASSSRSFMTQASAPTNVSASDGTYTDKVVVTWTKSTGATNYEIWKDGVGLGLVGDISSYDDTGAAASVITPGTCTASDGLVGVVTLTSVGYSIDNGTNHSYLVVPWTSGGPGISSSTETGYRGHGGLIWQWYVSLANSDANYQAITNATASIYNSYNSYATTRYYKCSVSAEGAVTQYSTPDTGYEIDAATITINAATSVTATGATISGNIGFTGGENPTVTLYWGTTDGGTTAGSWANNSAPDSPSQPQGVASFTKNLTGLSSGTTYYFRASATNSSGTTWVSSSLSFLTMPAAPTNVSATDGTYTDKVRVTWTKSTGANNYHVWRDSTDLGAVGDVATYDDTGAAPGVITPGTAAATDGTHISYVALSLSGTSIDNGTAHTYKVVAYNDTGNSADSATNTGYRGPASLTYQWQKSLADSDLNYSNITGGTTASYNTDIGVSSYSTGRYFKCVVSATGSVSQTSTVDRGYQLTNPSILAKAATNVSFTTAKLNSEITADGGDSEVQVRFGYGTVSQTAVNFENYEYKTNWVGGYHSGDLAPATVTGLTISTVYYYRVQVKNTASTVTSTAEIKFDTTNQYSSLTDYTIDSGVASILIGNPLMPPQMYTEGDVSKIPGGEEINDILDLSSTPYALWWYPFIFFGLGIFGLLIYGLTVRNGNNEGSLALLVLTIVIEAGLILFGIIGIANTSSLIPLFPAFLFLIPAIAVILSKKHQAW